MSSAVARLAVSVGAFLLAAPAVAARPAQLAIVIGNNIPDTRDRALLRYADDDAIAMHRLLLEAGIASYLLASPDADTRALNPNVRVTGAPRWRDLERVVSTVAGELVRARAQGRPAEVVFYFSGHGDVADGEGYLALGDRRLTRTLLFEGVLARLPAARRHVIVDACKSYLLATPRGVGGSRSELAGGFLATRRAAIALGTGFLLSTSSARDSHEWERYQGGVFSHQLRSALRGAADVNGDGGVAYAEIGAFLRAASRAIANPLLRPDFTLRAPGGDLAAPLVRWPRQRAGATRLTVDREHGAHLLVESGSGLRLADLPPTRGEVRTVHLPAERPLYLRRQDGSLEFPLEAEGDARLSALAPRPAQLARKGALNAALEKLFSTPFGQADVARYRASYSREVLEERLVQQTALEDEAREQGRRRWRRRAGVTALTAGILGLTLGAVALERYASAGNASQVERDRRNPVIRGLGVTGAVLGGVAAAAGTAWLVLTLRARSSLDVSLSPGLGGAFGARVAVHGW